MQAESIGRKRRGSATRRAAMDKYERLHKIGEGAYGEVFKCVHRATGEAVAIKRFTDSDEDPNIRKMCTRELGMLKVCRQGASQSFLNNMPYFCQVSIARSDFQAKHYILCWLV
jgi:serine/threonine protein kinase